MPLKQVSKVRITILCLYNIETIVFDMDNTIMTTIYKKNEIQEYDAATYVKLFGHSALKVIAINLSLIYFIDLFELSTLSKGDVVRVEKE